MILTWRQSSNRPSGKVQDRPENVTQLKSSVRSMVMVFCDIKDIVQQRVRSGQTAKSPLLL